MFWIFNKDKIVAYVVAICTVFVLFLMASVFGENPGKIIETSAKNDKLHPIYNVETKEKKVALTINCAWNADDMDTILETLNKNDIKITFFMVGNWIEKYTDVAKKIYENGHELANHSYSHPHVNKLSKDENIEQIKKCSELIKQITGKPSTLYRGPYGEYNNSIIEATKEMKHKAIQWSIDTLDYKALTGEQMWERIKPNLENGSIILMHNGTENTALSLNMIIQNIQLEGYEIVPVSELIYKENYIIDMNGTQRKA